MYSCELMDEINEKRIRPLSKYEYRKKLKLLRKEKPDLLYFYTPEHACWIRWTMVRDEYVDWVKDKMLE